VARSASVRREVRTGGLGTGFFKSLTLCARGSGASISLGHEAAAASRHVGEKKATEGTRPHSLSFFKCTSAGTQQATGSVTQFSVWIKKYMGGA
jgi:hypothetical protein